MLRHSGSVIPVLALALLATTCGDKSPESPRCRLAVVSPNGGEWLVAGSVHTILWSTDGPCGSQVRLELIRDGAVCDTIAAAIPDTGEHAWLCSPCGADSLAYRVRVVVLPGGQADASDGEFSIRSRPAPVCSLRLTAPLGGERVRVGETLLVAWEAGSACGDSVRLELLRDGLACATIAAAAAAATSFAWAAEPCGGDSSGYSIRVTDPAWGVADESPGTFVIVPPPAEACALGLVSPNGGETYTAGDPVSIAWESSGACADSVTLELLRDGSHCATIAVCPGGDGVYTWIAEPCGPAASGYAVRVSESSAPRPAGDTSDGTFAILPAPLPCHLALLSPGDGMAFRAGDGVAVSWSASGACADSVSIELLRAGTPCALLAAATPNDGSFDWIAVPCAGESEGYALRVRERGGSAAATSAGVFRIDPAPVPCSLTLIAPAGGGVYEMGAELPIAWSSHGDCADSVGITLLLDGVPCDTLALSTANDGGFAWIVAPCGPAGGGFTIRVAERGGTAADESAAPFVIVEPPSACGIEILAPAGGAALRVGEGLEIAWSASGTCGSWVRVDLLLGEGVCLPIAASTENDGSLAWVVQRCGENAEGYRLRVTDLASGLAFESAAPFSITTPCAIELTAPNGGEVFCPGESVAIAWQTRGGCGQTVSVELLFDGEPCATIAAATENDGHFSWTADACAGPGSGYAVRVTDPQTGAGDASDDVWAIEQPCALSLLHPSGGELLCTGSECLIAWQSGSCCGQTVLLELLHEGVVCQTIAAAASNSGEYAWVVAPCPGADEGYRVRVTDPLTLQSAESGETLRIAPECELRVTAPASGQSFCPGDAVAIAWERGACCGELVRIELLRNDEVCAEIAGETENDGSYEWPAAACAGGPDGYQVRVTDLSTLRSADGEGPFEIAGECALTVTSPNGGETLCVGRTVTLHWDAGACCGTTVALELLHEDAVCALIAPAAPNTGSYAFTVFSCGPGGGGYRLRVTDAAGVASDASDATFSILTDPCALRVTAPAGGERLSPGETLEIAWESSTCCG
ncbi:MAG: hypothetical protein FJY75_02565, partial [Candidatus Eisenbacteria bacterium]|nr:hypothetical protein [Candidatus Eisenbacteria bacterium]